MLLKILFKLYAYVLFGILKVFGYDAPRLQGWRDMLKAGIVSCEDLFKQTNKDKRLLIAYYLLLPWGKLLAMKRSIQKEKKSKGTPSSDFYPID